MHFCSFFHKLCRYLTEIGTASFIIKMKVLRVSMTLSKTVPCLNVHLPCCCDILQTPKTCAVVHISLFDRVHMASVVTLHNLRLVGGGNVSYVEARQKDVRLAGTDIKEAQEKC